jgi:UDP-N-acetylmuramate--alanine ligase
LVSTVLRQGGLDPTVVIGGRLRSIGTNASLGGGEYLVAEADESDGSFLRLMPTIAIITNIDPEHLDYWRGGLPQIVDAFVDFANKVPFYGAVVACADDAELCNVMPQFQRRVITYGISAPITSHHPVPLIFGADVRLEGYGSHCIVQRYERRGGTLIDTLGELTLGVPGHHSVRTADSPRCARRFAVRLQNLANVLFLAVAHDRTPQLCGRRSDGPSMCTVWQ